MNAIQAGHSLIRKVRALPEQLATRTVDYIGKAVVLKTVKEYERNIERFKRWAKEHKVAAVPAVPEIIAAYVVDLFESDFTISSIEGQLVAVRRFQRSSGVSYDATRSPLVRKTMQGLCRKHCRTPYASRPLLVSDIIKVVSLIPIRSDLPVAARDRAILLTGFAGALHTDSLLRMRRKDVTISSEGATLLTTHGSSPQRIVSISRGQNKNTCPVRALKLWMEISEPVSTGPLFLHRRYRFIKPHAMGDQGLQSMVRRRCRDAGIDSSRISFISLRLGFLFTAFERGIQTSSILEHADVRGIHGLPKPLANIALAEQKQYGGSPFAHVSRSVTMPSTRGPGVGSHPQRQK